LFLQDAVEERVLHVQLMNWPVARAGQGEDGANRRWFDHGREGLAEVDAGALSETADDPPGLVPLERAICPSLVPENPLACDNICVRWPGNKDPGLIRGDGIDLFGHGRMPIGIP
jgi:hypothetical protein